jgi:bifunctional pyridoxal-dependent enzyme with beta-cystathionase and maltose regulon repressor activities
MIVKEVDLDSVVEAADDNLTQEFRERVKKIIDREYGYREKKKDYEKQIIDFIKSNNN